MKSSVTAIGPEITNGAERIIAEGKPYSVQINIVGTADLILHRWNCEAIEVKGGAAKGSKAKKSDDVESYVYRNAAELICLPGEYMRQSIIHAAKYRQDPRSPRKSAMDLYKAAIVTNTMLAPIGPKSKKEWDYIHKCRVQVQRNGITRCRPAFTTGWTAEFDFSVLLPEYIRPQDLLDVLTQAGKLIGLADFRPTYGRFQVTSFDVGA